jgi:hypothetical protein
MNYLNTLQEAFKRYLATEFSPDFGQNDFDATSIQDSVVNNIEHYVLAIDSFIETVPLSEGPHLCLFLHDIFPRGSIMAYLDTLASIAKAQLEREIIYYYFMARILTSRYCVVRACIDMIEDPTTEEQSQDEALLNRLKKNQKETIQILKDILQHLNRYYSSFTTLYSDIMEMINMNSISLH